MKKSIYHSNNLRLNGQGVTRDAVRGILIKGAKILLIYSSVNGDYKFPGGGVEKFESKEKALKREFKEECGLKEVTVHNLVGVITEYDTALEKEYDFFSMNSYYYKCSSTNYNLTEQNLDNYESELKFEPIWVDIDDAIRNNKYLLKSGKPYPNWVKRETMFLEFLSSNILIEDIKD